MTIYAWTTDNTTSAGGPDQFTAKDLKRLKPGQILVGSTSKPVMNRAAFDALECSQ